MLAPMRSVWPGARVRVRQVLWLATAAALPACAAAAALSAPSHGHALLGTPDAAITNSPTNNVFAQSTGATVFPYGTDQPLTTLHPNTIPPVGGSQPHNNFQPYLCINFIISMFGIFPSPT